MRLTVRIRPGARADHVGGRWDGARGAAVLVAVRARAVDGRSNEAVLAVVAEAFGLRRADVVLVSGRRGRDKTLELTGDPELLAARAAELLAG